MPAWWPHKSKSKPKPESAVSCGSSPRKKSDPLEEDDEGPNPTRTPKSKLKRPDKKEKTNSFDEALARKTARDLSPVNGCGGGGGVSGPLFTVGHPLPRPVSSPLPLIPHDLTVAGPGSDSASTSASSISSDETPDLMYYRYSDPISMPRGINLTHDSQRQQHMAEDKHQFMANTVLVQPRCPDILISPKKEFNLFNLEAPKHHQSSANNIFNTVNCPRGHPLPTSPVHPREIGICPGSPKLRQDDLKCPPHPLPLPPGSPGSASSRSFPSQCKKGKLLGRGTFGHVYLGFNSESGQMCAIKEVKVISEDKNSKECLRQLNQEISLLSQLSHPNIVEYYGSELVDDTLSVYLEYVSGGSIYKLLQEYGPFGEPVIRNYVSQILSGLAYLHGRNTVHRDIKGANILVDPNGEVKLADFGMAKHISANTLVRSFKGSPYWMAPEVIMNGNGYNLSVDIWSLGCTVLEMATSKPPWSQYEGIPAIFKIGNSKDIPDIPGHLSSDAKSFLKLCLQRDPAARPTAAKLMDHPFVRDQALIKATKSNMFRNTLPSLSAGTHRMTARVLFPNRSISPLRNRDYGVGHFVEFPSVPRNQSDLLNMRMNMSLPVSPCSSPPRQFKQSNIRSRLPPPSHPTFSAPRNQSDLLNMRMNMSLPASPCSSPPRQFKQSNIRSCLPSPRHPVFSAPRNRSDLLNMRMNMSLPASPCSSPPRQFKQSNIRSCLPSPRHPAFSAGAINYSLSNCFQYPARPSNNFEPWPDIPQLKCQTRR